jgi:hypothetical protein
MFSGLCYRIIEESKGNEKEMSVAQGFHVDDEENSNTKEETLKSVRNDWK